MPFLTPPRGFFSFSNFKGYVVIYITTYPMFTIKLRMFIDISAPTLTGRILDLKFYPYG
jgi:hypothetical protein